jgi:polyphenol oxidase
MRVDEGRRPRLLNYDTFLGTTAFSSTRQGGFSEGPFASFNINRYCGDSPAHIAQNRQALCRELHIGDDNLIMPHQTHSTHVLNVDEPFMALDKTCQTARLEDTDALTTRLMGVCIGVSTADCVPILLYDARHSAAAAIHAGWRGTKDRIVECTIRSMEANYGSAAADLKAVIGPSISQQAFEVGDEVYDAFGTAGHEMQKIACRMANADGETKWHIDLWEDNRLQMTNLGMDIGNIHVAGICTYNHADRFFSARRLTVNSGRIFTGILI